MNIRFNKNKSIGKVLFIVEGENTEPYILRKIFTKVFDFQFEENLRNGKYIKYNSKENPSSKIFVINTEESNIKFIKKDNNYLDNMFVNLIENFDFDVDNAAIFYIFDRDNKSNTDSAFIESLLGTLKNSRDNGYDRQGILLLSYPSVESFTVSNFEKDCFEKKFSDGYTLKRYAGEKKYNHQKIDEATLGMAVDELLKGLEKIGDIALDVDDFESDNKKIYNFEEASFQKDQKYNLLSLLTVALIDLGLVEICGEETGLSV